MESKKTEEIVEVPVDIKGLDTSTVTKVETIQPKSAITPVDIKPNATNPEQKSVSIGVNEILPERRFESEKRDDVKIELSVDPNGVPNVKDSVASILRDNSGGDILDEEVTGSIFVSKAAKCEYIITPKEYDTQPIVVASGQYGMVTDIQSTSGFEGSSSAITTSEVTYRMTMPKTSETITGESYVKAGVASNALNTICTAVFSAVHNFVGHLTYPIYEKVMNVPYNIQGTVNRIIRNRRTVQTTSPPNGHPLIGSEAMSNGPKEVLIGNFDQAEDDDEGQACLGVMSTNTSAGARNVKVSSLELVPSSYAYANSVIDDIIQDRNFIQGRLIPVIESILPNGASVSYQLHTDQYGPNFHVEPYLSGNGVIMQQMLLNGSPAHQNNARTAAHILAEIAQLEINSELINNIQDQLKTQGVVGTALSTMIRPYSRAQIADLGYSEVAPNLWDVKHDYDLTASAGPEMMPVLMDIFAAHIIMPGAMAQNRHEIIPHVMKCISTLQFGVQYLDQHRYSNNDHLPKIKDQGRFYMTDNYPNILKPEGGANLSQAMQALREIIYAEGVPLDNLRRWDNLDKPIRAAVAHCGPYNGRLQVLQTKIRAFRVLCDAIMNDRHVMSWSREAITQLKAALEKLVQGMNENVSDLHYSYGMYLKGLASSPATNVPVPNLMSDDVERLRGTAIVRNGLTTYGRRTEIVLKQGYALTMLLGFRTPRIDLTGKLVHGIEISNDDTMRLGQAFCGLLIEGEKAAIAMGISQAVVEYITNSVESIAPFNNNSRDWVTANMRAGCSEPQDAHFVRRSVPSDNFIINPRNIGMLVAARSTPSVIVSYIQLEVSKIFPSQLSDFFTTSDGTHTGAYIKSEVVQENGRDVPRMNFYYRYGTENDQGDRYISERVTFMESSLMNLLAMDISCHLEPTDPSARQISGIVITGTAEDAISRFRSHVGPHTIDWVDFIKDAKYQEVDEEGIATDIVYDKVWLVTSMKENIDNIPADITHLGLLTQGGAQTMSIVPRFDNMPTYGLYICERDSFGTNLNEWVAYNPNRKVILVCSSAQVVKTDANWSVITSLVNVTSSTDYRPGNFVFYDPYTVFIANPSDFIGSQSTNVTNKEYEFYMNSPYIAHVPPLFDDTLNFRERITIGMNKQRQFVRFLDTEVFLSSILAR